ncbi:hypothetical protein J4N42_00910 [Vibrio sp. SCSIO 43135]|uniref:hypothetical protein n=1 Tax=Vibrio sp. SCSIO 43135 TaxID=2819096 RepID=UPI002075CF6E|nr:hypothetical protein [Vibrio sp. SCSIO 43135]USD41325.1 hypothetical protein J4N42_00910 [Vibrio sp. SCSIO 43135]
MMNNKWLLGLCALILAGCSSQPRHVEASLPLVAASIESVGTKVPASYRQDLEDMYKTELIHDKYHISLGPFYISSLGNECRELTIEEPEQGKTTRVVCAEKKQYEDQIRAWYLVPDIIQSSSSIQL